MRIHFYNLITALMCCFSAHLYAQPVVNLGNDTAFCASSFLLDAANAGASYLWNTGATSQQITATSTGNYSVTVTDGSGSSTDNINLNFLPTPSFTLNDTSLCSGLNTISLQGASGFIYNWYNAPTGGNLLNTGQNWANVFNSSATYYVGGENRFNAGTAGLSAFLVGGGSNYYYITSPRGLYFNVLQNTRLLSVQIPVQGGNLAGTVQIYNAANALIYSQNVSLVSGFNTIVLNYNIAAGNGYRIVFNNISGTGSLHVSAGASLIYPMNSSRISVTSGFFNNAPTGGQYNFFYNFQFADEVCSSPRQDIAVSVTPSPLVVFPNDTSSCTGSISLNASNLNAAYLWSTGETTATISTNQSGSYWARAQVGACAAADTVNVLIGSNPSFNINDTSLCSGANTLAVQGSNAFIYNWYDAIAGGNLLNTGQTWATNFNNSSTYYVAGENRLNAGTAGLSAFLVGGGSNYYYITAARGLVFNVLQNTRLLSVQIPVQGGSLTGTVQILNASNLPIYTQNVSLTSGFNTINLNYNIAAGSGYRIIFTNISGTGSLHVSAGASLIYPMNSSRISVTSGFFNNAPNSGQYNFFYNFQFADEVCTSPRQDIIVSVTPSPVVNFPNDTILCSQPNLVLDASNSGASYLWSTGETSATISLFQSDRVWVRAQRGICSSSDTVNAFLLDTAQFTAHDTSFCAGNRSVQIQGPANYTYFWWSAANGGNLQNTGLNFNGNFTNTGTYHIEAQTTKATFFEALPNNQQINGVGSAFYAITDTRGMTFTALSNFLLKSVRIYADGLVTGQVELQQANGAVVYSKNISLVSGANQVELNFPITAGNYRLVLRNPTGGGRLFADAPDAGTTYPLNYAHIRITANILNNNVVTVGYSGQIYSHFYNWEIVETACPTARYPLTATVLPTPVVNLPNDTVICGTAVILDASHPNNTNASYFWSNGITTPQVSVSQSDTLSVVVTIGACVVKDTSRLQLASPPTFVAVPNDTTVCGGTLTLRATTDGFLPAWYADSNSANPLVIADSIVYNATATDTLWVAGVGFMPKLNSYGQSSQGQIFPTNYVSPLSMYATRGLEFDARTSFKIDQVSIFVDSAAVSAKLILLDKFGFEKQSMRVNLPIIGENVVNLGWVVLADAGYKIILDSISGGKVYANAGAYPMVYPEMVIQRGFPAVIGSVYNYFFKIKISTPSCPTARYPIKINVPPYPVLSLRADTAVCDDPNPIQLTATSSNPNYSYRWSTGATSNQISVSSSGLYAVTVTNQGLCATTQSSLVQYLSRPAAPNVSDTTICSSQQLILLQSNPNQIYNWFNINGNQVYIDAPFSPYVQDSSFFVLNNGGRAVTRLGAQDSRDPQNLNLYNSFIIPNTFDVQTWSVLESVAAYFETAPATFEVILRDANGRFLQSKTLTINQARTKQVLPLGFSLPPAMGYQLQFANINSRFLVNPSLDNRSTLANIATLTGTTLAGVNYPCFFDWNFAYSLPACASAADTFAVAVRLPLRLPDSLVFVCDSFVADVQANNAVSYLWSDGNSSPRRSLRNEGLYTVTISDGAGCVAVDSVQVDKPMPVGLPTNGISCERLLVTNYSNIPNSRFVWSIGATTSTLLIPDTATYRVTVTSPEGCTLIDSAHITQIERIPFFDLGLNRNICIGDTLFNGILAENANISYQWSTGAVGNFILINQSGLYVITATSSNQCTATDSVIIIGQNPPVANFVVFYQQDLGVGLNNLSQNYNSYFYDYGVGSGGTSASFHTYDTAGCYTISLFVQSSCGEDSSSLEFATEGAVCDTGSAVQGLILEQNQPDFKIFPNPNAGIFQLSANFELAQAQLFIYNSQGQVVYNQMISQTQNVEIRQNNLASGLYFVRLQSDKINLSRALQISH